MPHEPYILFHIYLFHARCADGLNDLVSLQGDVVINNNNNIGKPLTWDVTVICPLADSYVAAAAREAAEEAATRKMAKYANIQAHHIFQPVAVESLGPINASGRVFLSKLGRKLADQSGDDRVISFLFQRLSVLIQRYNAILLHDCFVKEEEE